jgi:hypothetical protein
MDEGRISEVEGDGRRRRARRTEGGSECGSSCSEVVAHAVLDCSKTSDEDMKECPDDVGDPSVSWSEARRKRREEGVSSSLSSPPATHLELQLYIST